VLPLKLNRLQISYPSNRILPWLAQIRRPDFEKLNQIRFVCHPSIGLDANSTSSAIESSATVQQLRQLGIKITVIAENWL
jgi:hypothetical protein